MATAAISALFRERERVTLLHCWAGISSCRVTLINLCSMRHGGRQDPD